MTGVKAYLLILALAFTLAEQAYAADSPPFAESPHLQACLKRADDLPDMAAAEATAWMKNDGGNDAHLCHAFAQSNRGMHTDAAREFWFLASYYDKHDLHRAILMHNLSGLEFLRTKDIKNASIQYASSLKIDPSNPTALIGHAESYMAIEKYWDALNDLNRVLKKNPNDMDALRQRGLAWEKVGSDKNAQEDFGHVEALESTAK